MRPTIEDILRAKRYLEKHAIHDDYVVLPIHPSWKEKLMSMDWQRYKEDAHRIFLEEARKRDAAHAEAQVAAAVAAARRASDSASEGDQRPPAAERRR
jgi:hypothetical protein